MDLKDIEWEFVHSIDLPRGRIQWWTVANTVLHHRIPRKRRNFLTTRVTSVH
jgi:hypothetical protein